MRYVDYIYNAGSGNYGLDLGYRPTTATSVEVRGMPYTDGGLWIGTGPESSQPYGQWFRLFTHEFNRITFDCPEDSSWRAYADFGGSADYEDFGFGFNTDGDIYLTTTAGTETTPMYNYDLSALDGINNSTLKCWGDGTYFNGGTSKFYEIWIYESGQLVRHYLPAVENGEAGLYEEIGQQFYGKVAGSPDISWQEKPIIEYSGGTNVVFEASGGSFSARLQVNNNLSAETYHWAVKQLTNTTAGSACTISYNGQTGLTEFSGKTDGVYDFDYVMEPWSGSSADSRYRSAIFHITIYDDATGEPAGFEDNIQRIRQKNPQIQGKPLYLGRDEVNTMYLGTDEVVAAYLGEDLVFDAGSVPPVPPTPPANRVLTITDMGGLDTYQSKGICVYNSTSGGVYPQVMIDIHDDGVPEITEYESGYTITSASDYSFVVEGPMTSDILLDETFDIENCGQCQSGYQLTFVNDSASTAHAGSGMCEARPTRRIVIEDIPYGEAFMDRPNSNAGAAISDGMSGYWDMVSTENNTDFLGCLAYPMSAETDMGVVSFIVEAPMTDNISIFFYYNDEDGTGCHVDENEQTYEYTFSEGETALTISYPTIICDEGECNYDTCSGDPECLCNCGGGNWIEVMDESVCECMQAEDENKCNCLANGNDWIVPEVGDPYCQQVCHDNDPQCNCEKNGGNWEEVGPDEWSCNCSEAADEAKCECEKQGMNFYWDGDNRICRNRAVEDCEERFPADEENICGCLGGIWDSMMNECDCQGDPDCESRFQPPV